MKEISAKEIMEYTREARCEKTNKAARIRGRWTHD